MTLLYEVHTRQWLHELGARDLRAVPEVAIDALARIGVTHLWLMGVWPTGPRARQAALSHHARLEYTEALPDWHLDDVAGSPYAIAEYRVAADFGGDEALAALRARLATRGIKVILDFVPNHVAVDHAFVKTELVVSSPTRIADAFPDGKRFVAHGKDPYFPSWIDTAQLDYRRAATRAAMRDVLVQIAARCDGVRCDMAMLLLPEVFEQTWAHVPSAEPAADFWGDAIATVRRAHREFVFLAEAYWGLEDRLVGLGFDYAYDKELYDLLVQDRPDAAVRHVSTVDNVHRVHFLENHDEARAAALPLDVHRAAALLICALPGLPFLHHGQLDGARRFARIQLRRRAVEAADGKVREIYERLLPAVAASSVGRGEGRLLAPAPAWDGNPTASAFVIVKWPRDLVVVNLAPHRAQCRVQVGEQGRWRLVDRLGDERWERDLSEALFLDLPARGAQLFELQRMT